MFTRNSTTTLAFRSCVNDAGSGACAAGKNVNGLSYLAISPDGEDLVGHVETAPKGLVMLNRSAATGDLGQRTGTNEVCVSTTGAAFDGGAADDGDRRLCRQRRAGGRRPRRTSPPTIICTGSSEDGGGAIVAVKRDFPPICPDRVIEVTRNTSVAVSFNCTDRNGDAMTYTTPTEPVKGTLGAIDNSGGLVFYGPFGDYVGGDSFRFRAFASPQSSNVATAAITVVAPVGGPPAPQPNPTGIDADKDGFFAGQDCNDTNAAIRPGAIEIKGNRLDENCDGLAEAFPTIDVRRGEQVGRQGLRLTLTSLQVTQQFPKGWRAKLALQGRQVPVQEQEPEGREGLQGRLDDHQRRSRSASAGSGPDKRSRSGSARRTSTPRSRGWR